MSTSTVVKLLINLAKQNQKSKFLQVLNSHSVLKANPETMGPRNVSMLIHSFGNLRLSDKEYWRVLENYFHDQKGEMNAHDFAMSIWGFSQSSKTLDNSTAKSLELGTRQFLTKFTGKELTGVCYSFALMDLKSKILWDSLKNALLGQLYYIPGENVPAALWAFSKMGIKDEKLWYMLERKMFLELKNLTPSSQSIVIYGFAITSTGSEELWKLFEKTFYENINEFSDKDIKNIIWSFRKMKRNNENKLCADMVEMLKSDFDKFSIGTIVGLGHAIKETTGITAEFKEMLYKSFADEEKVKNMTYAHLISFAKLLFHTKIRENELWDKLALRLRQMLPSTPVFDIKGHLFFMIQSPSYWHFVCEESLILHFERFSKMDEKTRERAITTEAYIDIISVAHYCYSNKLGSKEFWTQCAKFLQLQKIGVRDMEPMILVKLMYLISGRFPEVNGLMNYWLEYESEVCTNMELLQEIMKDYKALRLLMRSVIKLDRFSLLLKQLEKVYDSYELAEDETGSFISKILNWKKDGENRRKYPIQMISNAMESYDYEAKKEILKGIFENWFNLYLGAQYPPRAMYQDLYVKLNEKQATMKKDAQEKEEKVNEEEEAVEEGKQEFQDNSEKVEEVMLKPSDLIVEDVGTEAFDGQSMSKVM